MFDFNVRHTSVKIMQWLMVSIGLLQQQENHSSLEKLLMSTLPLTEREQSPFPDHLKATHFILKNKFVKADLERKTVKKFPN